MSSRPCPVRGCYQLKPCPDHPERPTGSSWSPDRNRAAQARFRTAVLTRDGHRCTRCGATDQLVAHHDRPGMTPDCGRTLCTDCHTAVDNNAR